jgi:HEAT repeat protein
VLGEFGSNAAAAAPALVETLHDADAWVRLEAGWALQQMHKAAVPLLAIALRDDKADEDFRRSAAVTLGLMGRCAEAALKPLVQVYEAADTSTDLRLLIIEALGRIGPAAGSTIPLLVEASKCDLLASAASQALRHVKKGPWAMFVAALHEGARLLVITAIVATVFGTLLSIFGRLETEIFPTAGGIGLAASCACGLLCRV